MLFFINIFLQANTNAISVQKAGQEQAGKKGNHILFIYYYYRQIYQNRIKFWYCKYWV